MVGDDRAQDGEVVNVTAQEIRRERVLANFRKRGPKKPHRNSERFKKRPGMDADHLELIRKLPCCVTGKVPAGEAHHLKAGTGERGIGLRSTDKWAVPMAHDPHMEVERAGTRNELAWFEQRGIDAHVLAQDLWAARGDLAKMTKIVIAHRAERR